MLMMKIISIKWWSKSKSENIPNKWKIHFQSAGWTFLLITEARFNLRIKYDSFLPWGQNSSAFRKEIKRSPLSIFYGEKKWKLQSIIMSHFVTVIKKVSKVKNLSCFWDIFRFVNLSSYFVTTYISANTWKRLFYIR